MAQLTINPIKMQRANGFVRSSARRSALVGRIRVSSEFLDGDWTSDSGAGTRCWRCV